MSICLEHIAKSYQNLQVFEDLNLNIPDGEVTCIMGQSGCGKTTLLRLLMGLEMADGGRITGLANRRISAVFQDDTLCLNLTAFRNIQLVCAHSVSREEIEAHFSAVGLEDIGQKPVRDLSGGMRRRVAIIRALLADADVVFLDEPFKGLDKENKEKVVEYTRTMAAGKTVIMVTHNEEEAELMGGRIFSLDSCIVDNK